MITLIFKVAIIETAMAGFYFHVIVNESTYACNRRPSKLTIVSARPYDKGVSILFREALAIFTLEETTSTNKHAGV